eukprot:jgi/Hompol1/6122/HPOL_000715-RA
MTGFKRTILLPTDFSDQAAKALVWAARWIIQHDDRVFLLHSLEDLHSSDATTDSSEAEALYQGAERKLNEWAKELRRQLHGKHAFIETKVAFGSAGVSTVQFASGLDKLDLVVLAMHGQTDLQSSVMGPVATYVTTFFTKRPVILVHDVSGDDQDLNDVSA